MKVKRTTRSGFTLVELLVVIAIIGILIALLLPAVQAAREAGRRTACTSNLHNVGIALHLYHDVNNKLPPAMTLPWGGSPNNPGNYGPNWVIRILPYYEQAPLEKGFDLTRPINHSSNRAARGAELPAFKCPSDANMNGPKFRGDSGNWARGNYAINAHAGRSHEYNRFNDANYGGIAGVGDNQTVTFGGILDGTSNTLMVAEVKIGVNENDRRGTWAMGEAGASVLFWHGFGGDANGPNPKNDNSDDIVGCESLFGNPGIATLRSMGMTCWRPCPSYQAAPRSYHAGEGVVAAFCDASVHFVRDGVAGAAWAGYGSVWDHFITRADGATTSPLGY